MKVQPMLWRMTSPSLRTNLLVDTPTLAVCGAIGLPISAPTEFSVGSSSGGMPSCAPTSAWNLPNMAFVEVFEPERATPMKPSIGATMMNAVPMLEKPLAGQLVAREEQATAVALNQLTFGRGDQGPVQAATTTSSTAKGSQACSTSPNFSPCPCVCRAVAASTSTPP